MNRRSALGRIAGFIVTLDIIPDISDIPVQLTTIFLLMVVKA